MNVLKSIGIVLAAVAANLVTIVCSAVFCAIPVYFLWNWLMPDLFKLTEITFIQSIGICLLCDVLFNFSMTSKKEG